MLVMIALSRRYGSDPEAVLAGGGNTSAKDPDRMYIKCSGVQLATMDEAGFVPIDRHKLDAAMAQSYPAEDAAREAAFLQAVMATRTLPGETRRPSVEAPLHNLFPQRLVLHVHPALINGLTCSREGEAACRRLFGDAVLWIPLCRPGYVLASLCREAMAGHKARTGRLPQILLLQNHGIFVAGDTPAEIDHLYAWVRDTLAKEIRRAPDLAPAGREDPELTRRLKARCQMEYAAFGGRPGCSGPGPIPPGRRAGAGGLYPGPYRILRGCARLSGKPGGPGRPGANTRRLPAGAGGGERLLRPGPYPKGGRYRGPTLPGCGEDRRL